MFGLRGVLRVGIWHGSCLEYDFGPGSTAMLFRRYQYEGIRLEPDHSENLVFVAVRKYLQDSTV